MGSNCRSLHFATPGRDDKGEGGASVRIKLLVERTAGPSASLRSGRDDKGEGSVFIDYRIVAENTAGPSTTVSFEKLAKDTVGYELAEEEGGYAGEEDQGHADAGFAVDLGDEIGGGYVDGDAGGEGRPALTQVGSRLMAATPRTVSASGKSAELRAARRLWPPASITGATVKPSPEGALHKVTSSH